MRRVPLVALVAALSVASMALLGAGVHQTARGSKPLGLPDLPVDDGRDERPARDAPAAAHGMRFGIDASSVHLFEQHAGKPDYGTVWVGKWNLDHGWRDTDRALVALREAGVTPAVHFYYFGDDIQKACFQQGCNGKDTLGWQRLAEQLVQHLQLDLQGRHAVVILESEFNKHGVHESEELDAMLAEKARYIRWWYPNVSIVLGLGNWFPEAWGTWDEAAEASDYVGLQALAGSTRDHPEKARRLVDQTLDGTRRARDLFGKPVFIQDVAVSSYPEPDNLELQEEALERFAERLPELRDAGVEAVVYRSFLDVPDMALVNHYREAERHWGLAWHDSGELKPAGQQWIEAVQKARGPPGDVDGKGKADGGEPGTGDGGGRGGEGQRAADGEGDTAGAGGKGRASREGGEGGDVSGS